MDGLTAAQRIDEALQAYLNKNSLWPAFLYLGQDETRGLDREYSEIGGNKGVVLEYRSMKVVEVMKDKWLEFGGKND